MKTKKPKAAKLGKKKKRISDILPSTSLPPLVEGQVRCFLRITVSKILWIIPKPPVAPLVRLRWWGETSNGTLFHPRGSSHVESKSVKTTARYAVHCGPRQFTSYLADMGVLVLEVMTKADHLPIGRVQINGISQLSPTCDINGFFTVISPTSEKLGELQVSLALESLTDTCDSPSSIPTTDTSVDGRVTAQSPAMAHTSRTGSLENLAELSALHKLSLTSLSGKESLSSSASNTPRGRDHLYFQENGKSPTKAGTSETKQQLNSAPLAPTRTFDANSKRTEKHVLSAESQSTKNLISVLLDRGSKLRNAMVVSAMKTTPNGVSGLTGIPSSVQCQYIDVPKSKTPQSPSGKLFHNLLESEEISPTGDSLLPSPEHPFKECYPNTEATAINLLLGSSDSMPLHYWHGMHSPPESLSGGSSAFDASELNDPHYDKSLLENLFYKDSKYESSISDFTSEDEELDTSKKKLRTQALGKPDAHCQRRLSRAADLDQNKMQKIISHQTLQEDPLLSKDQELPGVELSVDRLALLGRINLARVIIETLKLPPDTSRTTPKEKGSGGKPPRPVSGRKCTYIVEYNFPVATSSRSGAQELYMGSEITRVASSKVTKEVVKFQQRFVFPICFDGLMIEHWWNSSLVFNIYFKKITQKKPILIGTASLALRAIIQSNLLSITSELPVDVMCDNKEKQQQIGPLKVSMELAADNKDFTSANARLAASPKAVYAVSSPGPKFPSDDNVVDLCPVDPHFVNLQARELLEKGNIETRLKQSHIKDVSRIYNANHPHLPSVPAAQSLIGQFNSSVEEEDGFLLHVLLMVPDGKDFITGDGCVQKQYNIYLKCKLFSTDEATRSPVSWSTSRPIFNFSLVAPITLTSTLLERLKNNMMIIEIWNKAITSGQENLLGLVKLPLHQFYISFRDPKISHLLLQAQYPVVAVDSYVPMIDVFTGNQRGSLRVLLAMGGADQIAALQKLKSDEVSIAGFQRTPHSLDAVPSVLSKLNREETEPLMEHIFEMNVRKLKGLTPLQSTVWGEADCYVQYYFPAQDANIVTEPLPVVTGIILKSFRTATTLCVPDPVFNDCQSHLLLIPLDLPVQRVLLDVCSKQKFDGGSGIQFEVWCRYYYPNVRDQVVARGVLPLSKLCGMVTMQHHKEVGVQTFSVPLIPRTENVEKYLPCSTGLLDVSVKYKCSVKPTEDAREGIISSRAVALSVQVLRASGLQAAARAVAERNHFLQYQSEVGVNTCVTIDFSFLPENERRRTKVVARTFCPEFDHYSEFPCNLIIQKSNGESFSLAELLQSSEAVFTIHHQPNKTAKPSTILIGSSRDIELGSVRIPLAGLLTKRTGISGWYAVNLPTVVASAQSCCTPQYVGGGLELSIYFAHPSDRERVIKTAEALEWKIGMSEEEPEEWESTESNMSLTIAVPRMWLPLHCVLLAGHAHLDKHIFCYLRYKFYDREAICTSLQKPILTDIKSQVTVSFDQAKTIFLKRTQSLVWYLKEEKLEVQVWVAYGKDKIQRPHDTDRLIGYSFIDLSTLTEKSSRKLTVSGIYPLFKRGASDLSGAALRFHITLVPNDLPPSTAEYTSQRITYSDDDYECSAKEDVPLINEKEQEVTEVQIDEELPTDSTFECNKVADVTLKMDLTNTFAVNVVVERAMHLSLKGCPLTEQTGVKPSCYVSYSTPVSPISVRTPLIENAYSPIWEHQQQTRLPKELLLDPQQMLVFKVWHKADIDRVIGFASVDLSPLLSGFMSICGWYNITDFSGQCQGQLKVAITPLENIYHLREKRWTQTHKQPASTAPTMESLLYKTSAKYNSFPSHISKYSEQFISTSWNPDALPASNRSMNTEVQGSRHVEHMENIRRFHQSLQQEEYNMQSAGNIESLPQISRTSLFSALRRNLSELDDIQRYFSQKLCTTPFSHMTNPTAQQSVNLANMNFHHGSSNSLDNEHYLLENSNTLVQEYCGINNAGVQKNKADVTCPIQSPRDIEDGEEEIAENIPQQSENERNKDFVDPLSSERKKMKPYLPQFCTPGNLELGQTNHDEFLEKDDIDYQNNKCSVEIELQQNHYVSDGCSEEEYEEDVIQPKTLNDVTVMTDRTSPWSSILSDFEEDNKHKCETKRDTLELIRNGSVADEAVSIPAHDEFAEILQNENCKLPSSIATSESPHTEKSSINEGAELDNFILQSECSSTMKLQERRFSDDLDMFFSNHDEVKDLTRENENFAEYDIFSSRTLSPTDKEETDLRIKAIHEEKQESCEECNNEDPQFFKAGGEDIPRKHKGTAETDTEEDKLSDRLPDPVIIPNFFLPSSHLEASMRVLNVPQSFQKLAADPSEIPNLTRTSRHSNRQKPRLTSKELSKEETERIAKIFAGHFTEKH